MGCGCRKLVVHPSQVDPPAPPAPPPQPVSSQAAKQPAPAK